MIHDAGKEKELGESMTILQHYWYAVGMSDRCE